MPPQATIPEDAGSVTFCVEVVSLGTGLTSDTVVTLATQGVVGIREADELIL